MENKALLKMPFFRRELGLQLPVGFECFVVFSLTDSVIHSSYFLFRPLLIYISPTSPNSRERCHILQGAKLHLTLERRFEENEPCTFGIIALKDHARRGI